MAVLAPAPTLAPMVTTNLHDVMIATLMDSDDLTAQDGNDLSMTAAIPAAQVRAGGLTENWIDLPAFIHLLESNNSKFVPTKTRPRFDRKYFQVRHFPSVASTSTGYDWVLT